MVASIKGQLAALRSDLTPSTSALPFALLLNIEFAIFNKYYAINTKCLDETEVMVASIKGQVAALRSDLTPSTSALPPALLLDIEFAVLNKYCTIVILSEFSPTSLSSCSSCWYRVGTHIAAIQKKVSFDTTLADREHVNHPLNESLFIRSKSRSIQFGLIFSIRARFGS